MKRRIRSQQFVIADTTGFWGRPAASLLLVLVALFLMTFSVLRPTALESVRTSFSDALLPALSIIARPVQDSAAMVRDISGLTQIQSEIAALRQENIRLQGWYQKALHLQTENQSLRGLMNVKPDVPYKFISARVVADAGNAYVKSLLVTAGSQDGVKKGQAVLSAQGLVGRVIEVGQTSSRILLITDMNSRVPVMLHGSGHQAVLTGENKADPALKYLPKGALPEAYTPVMTSGHGGVFPAGLPVGVTLPPLQNTVGDSTSIIQNVGLYTDFQAMPFVRIVDVDIDPNLKSGILDR